MTSQKKITDKLNYGFHICVGLDTDLKKIPQFLLREKEPILKFNKIVIENTYEYTAAYKINFAFYERLGAKGFELIQKTLEYIPKDVLTIADAKRGDIGNTSEMYAQSIFDEMKFDSVTLHPYMGYDSLKPFLDYQDKLNFILALTSNPSANDFEKLVLSDNKLLFQKVIQKVNEWNQNKNLGIVFGATNVNELMSNINLFDDLFVLLPGVGAQGGSLEDIVKIFNENNFSNYIVNLSRSLIYVDNSNMFGEVIKNSIIKYNCIVSDLAK